MVHAPISYCYASRKCRVDNKLWRRIDVVPVGVPTVGFAKTGHKRIYYATIRCNNSAARAYSNYTSKIPVVRATLMSTIKSKYFCVPPLATLRVHDDDSRPLHRFRRTHSPRIIYTRYRRSPAQNEAGPRSSGANCSFEVNFFHEIIARGTHRSRKYNLHAAS